MTFRDQIRLKLILDRRTSLKLKVTKVTKVISRLVSDIMCGVSIELASCERASHITCLSTRGSIAV